MHTRHTWSPSQLQSRSEAEPKQTTRSFINFNLVIERRSNNQSDHAPLSGIRLEAKARKNCQFHLLALVQLTSTVRKRPPESGKGARHPVSLGRNGGMPQNFKSVTGNTNVKSCFLSDPTTEVKERRHRRTSINHLYNPNLLQDTFNVEPPLQCMSNHLHNHIL